MSSQKDMSWWKQNGPVCLYLRNLIIETGSLVFSNQKEPKPVMKNPIFHAVFI